MSDNLSWSSGTGFLISTLASGDGAGNTAHFQRIIVQTGLLNVQGQMTAVGTVTAEAKGTITAEVKGTLTAEVKGTLTGEMKGFVTAQVSGGWPIGVQGISAHDSPVGGAPILGGLYALTGRPAAVAHGDIVYAAADKYGRHFVRRQPFSEDYLATACPAITGITGLDVFAAQGTGTAICVTEITVVNSNASTGTLVTFKNGTQAIHQVYCAAAGGGAVMTFDNNSLLVSANSAFGVACDNSGQVYVAAVGYRDVL